MPVILYVVAILVVVCGLCLWFFLERHTDKKRQKKLLDQAEIEQEAKRVEEKKRKEEASRSASLENFSLNENQQQEERDPSTVATKTDAKEQVDEDEEEDDDELEARFREYEKFLRERLFDDEDNDDEEEREKLPNEQRTIRHDYDDEEDEEEDEITARIRRQLNQRREAENLEQLKTSDDDLFEVDDFDGNSGLRFQRPKREQDEAFSAEDIEAINSFDMDSVKGKATSEIQRMLAGLPPRARKFLYDKIMSSRKN